MDRQQQDDPQDSTRVRGPVSEVDEVGHSGVYPASGPLPSGPAEVRGQSELAHPEERTSNRLLPPPRDEIQTTLNLLGRAVFGGYFIYSGINHFMNHGMFAQYARAKGVPLADVAVPLTGAMLVAGGLSLVLGQRPKLGTGLVMGFLATVSPTMHAFWADEDDQERMRDMTNFAKNIGLLGGALLAASLPEPWPTSIDRTMQRRNA